MLRSSFAFLAALTLLACAAGDPQDFSDGAPAAEGTAGADGEGGAQGGPAGSGGSPGGKAGAQAGSAQGGATAGSAQAGAPGGSSGNASAGNASAGNASAGNTSSGGGDAGASATGAGGTGGGATSGAGGAAGGPAGGPQGGAGAAGSSTFGGAPQGGTAGAAGQAAAGKGGGGQGGSPFGGGGMTGSAGSVIGTGGFGAVCPALLANDDNVACYACWGQAQTGACKAEFDACTASADCAGYFDCWVGCPGEEDSCLKKCANLFPAGESPFKMFRFCICNNGCGTECGDQCGNNGRSLNRCRHDVCTSGTDLDPTCSACAAEVCDSDPICCDIEWDGWCASKAEQVCGCPSPDACVHGECTTGAPLSATCSPCAAKVCAQRASCCDTFGKWDGECVTIAGQICDG